MRLNFECKRCILYNASRKQSIKIFPKKKLNPTKIPSKIHKQNSNLYAYLLGGPLGRTSLNFSRQKDNYAELFRAKSYAVTLARIRQVAGPARYNSKVNRNGTSPSRWQSPPRFGPLCFIGR